MRARSILPGLFLLAVGCKEPAAPPAKPKSEPVAAPSEAAPELGEGVRVKVVGEGGRCRRSLCVGGPGEPTSHAHFDLNELCRRTPGTVRRCEGELCTSVWPQAQWRAGLDGLIASLDKDGNGRLEGAEGECEISFGGWSTGAAIAATELPAALAERVDAEHAKVQNLVMIAPYVEGPEGPRASLELASNIETAFIYRSSVVPEGDCSHAFEGGPWTSPAPVCGPDTTCYDYDYGQNPLLAYIGRRGNRSGGSIGHCSMTSFVAKVGRGNLASGRESYAHLVPPYASGERGGRPRPEGGSKPPLPEAAAGL